MTLSTSLSWLILLEQVAVHFFPRGKLRIAVFPTFQIWRWRQVYKASIYTFSFKAVAHKFHDSRHCDEAAVQIACKIRKQNLVKLLDLYQKLHMNSKRKRFIKKKNPTLVKAERVVICIWEACINPYLIETLVQEILDFKTSLYKPHLQTRVK